VTRVRVASSRSSSPAGGLTTRRRVGPSACAPSWLRGGPPLLREGPHRPLRSGVGASPLPDLAAPTQWAPTQGICLAAPQAASTDVAATASGHGKGPAEQFPFAGIIRIRLWGRLKISRSLRPLSPRELPRLSHRPIPNLRAAPHRGQGPRSRSGRSSFRLRADPRAVPLCPARPVQAAGRSPPSDRPAGSRRPPVRIAAAPTQPRRNARATNRTVTCNATRLTGIFVQATSAHGRRQ
jgi:hypothetical protein